MKKIFTLIAVALLGGQLVLTQRGNMFTMFLLVLLSLIVMC